MHFRPKTSVVFVNEIEKVCGKSVIKMWVIFREAVPLSINIDWNNSVHLYVCTTPQNIQPILGTNLKLGQPLLDTGMVPHLQ